MDEGALLMYLVVFLAVFVAVFLLFREFFCWYWKINEQIMLQRQILAALTGRGMPAQPAARGADPAMEYAAGRISKQEYEQAVGGAGTDSLEA